MDPGTIVGVASIAIQLADSIQKLCNFCKAVKDAPQDVELLVRELNILLGFLNRSRSTLPGSEQDKLADEAIKNCQELVSRLFDKLTKAKVGLGSSSTATRTWSSIKKVLKDSEIQSMRSSVQEAKLTLMSCTLDCFQHSVDLHFQRQNQFLLEISQKLNHKPQYTAFKLDTVHQSHQSHTMQIYPEDVARYMDRPRVFPSPSALISKAVNFSDMKFPQLEKRSGTRPIVYNSLLVSGSQRFATPFLTVQKHAKRTLKFSKHDGMEVATATGEQIVYHLYPSVLLQKLGIVKGVSVLAQSIFGWTYTLQTFNTVPRNSAIFEFCRDGNLRGLKTILSNGQASLRDRDPDGRTPLWIAANSLQVEVAEFLMDVGSDVHTTDWEHKNTPLQAVLRSNEADVMSKLGIFGLLRRHFPDDYDTLDVRVCFIRLLMFYRPGKDISLTFEQKNTAAFQVIQHLLPYFHHESDMHRSQLAYFIMSFAYGGPILLWVLKSIKGPIHDWKSESSIGSEKVSPLHHAFSYNLLLRNPGAVMIIAQKSVNLHQYYRLVDDGLTPEKITPGTPTSIAMYQSSNFVTWRTIILELFEDIGDFVRKELEASTLKDEGWEQDTLLALFYSGSVELTPVHRVFQAYIPFDVCDRCGSYSGRSLVDLPWRRYLRSIRTKRYTTTRPVVRIDNITASPNPHTRIEDPKPDIQLDDTTSSLLARTWPYMNVCLNSCYDGVCVAWVYENDGGDDPFLPPYTPEQTEELELKVCIEELVEEPPALKIPGAFID